MSSHATRQGRDREPLGVRSGTRNRQGIKQTPSFGGAICNSMLIADDRLWIGSTDYYLADPKVPTS